MVQNKHNCHICGLVEKMNLLSVWTIGFTQLSKLDILKYNHNYFYSNQYNHVYYITPKDYVIQQCERLRDHNERCKKALVQLRKIQEDFIDRKLLETAAGH
jgi:hypothetical protein